MLEYDKAKAQQNLAKHGIDFAGVEIVFDDENAIETWRFMDLSDRDADGFPRPCNKSCAANQSDKGRDPIVPACVGCELRYLRTGLDSEQRLVSVTWTPRNGNWRVISARHARTNEKAKYHGT